MKIHIFIRNLKIIKINFTEKILLNLHKTKNLIMNNIIFHLNLKNNDIFIYILFYILLCFFFNKNILFFCLYFCHFRKSLII